jgi:hypothetical protein
VVAGIDAVPVWMSAAQFEYWKHTHLTIDVVKGRGSGFSLEATEGVRFLIRSRLLTDHEVTEFGLVYPLNGSRCSRHGQWGITARRRPPRRL